MLTMGPLARLDRTRSQSIPRHCPRELDSGCRQHRSRPHRSHFVPAVMSERALILRRSNPKNGERESERFQFRLRLAFSAPCSGVVVDLQGPMAEVGRRRRRDAGRVCDPVSMAYASLAGLPPQHGIYCYLLGGLCYAVFGTSRQLAIGPTSAIALLVGATAPTWPTAIRHAGPRSLPWPPWSLPA